MSSSNVAMILDSVIGTLVSSYDAKPEAPKASKVRAKAPKAPRTAKAEKAPVAAPRKIVATIPVPAVGTLDAAGFLLAIRQAGKIRKANDAGVMITINDPAKEKADQIQAIAAFVGYDFSGAHGVQLDTARRTAQFNLRPVKADSKVAVTVKGFVAGMPNGTAKVVNDLRARIRLATDTMLDHEKEAEKHETDSAEHATHMALATVESERIAHMRRDLANIIGE